MKANNSLMANRRPTKPTFSMVINSQSMQQMIGRTLNDPRRAASFTASLISAVSASPQLAACKPESIISAALSGEAMDLSLRLGQYSIVPYGDTANYQLSYKGLSQLAMRSNMYTDFDAFDVREGEYGGKNPRTRQPVINWIDDEDERESKPLAGIYAFYELKSGFFKSIYWSHEKILNHADRYSQAFSKATYEKMLNGELSTDEVTRIQKGSPWYGEPLSEQHLTMCKKTLLLRLLGDGKAPLSVEMREALDNEREQERGGAVIFPDDPAVVSANATTNQGVEDEGIVDAESTVEDVAVNSVPHVRRAEAPQNANPATAQPTPAQPAPAKSAPVQPAQKPKPAPRTRKEVKEEPPIPMQGDLSQYMNPPVNTDGLPFN